MYKYTEFVPPECIYAGMQAGAAFRAIRKNHEALIKHQEEEFKRFLEEKNERLSKIELESKYNKTGQRVKEFLESRKEKGVMPSNDFTMLLNNLSNLYYEKDKEIAELKRKAHQKPYLDELAQAWKDSGVYDDFGTECIKGE